MNHFFLFFAPAKLPRIGHHAKRNKIKAGVRNYSVSFVKIFMISVMWATLVFKKGRNFQADQ